MANTCAHSQGAPAIAKATYADRLKAIGKELPSQQYPQQPNLSGTVTMKQWKALV